MKKSFSLLVALMVLAAAFTGCKRGEDDPALSFASRDGRLMRGWKLAAWDKLTTTDINGTVFTSTKSYDGTLLTTVNTAGISSSKSYTLELTFDKHGSLSVKEVEDGDLMSDISYWQWLNADKKKVVLVLNSGVFGGSFYVNRLSSKELVLESNYTEVDDPSNTDITTVTVTETISFDAI